jgi:hypothetical protein
MKAFKCILISMMILSFSGFAIAQDTEEITLTTYYPAPYGEYDGLSATSMAIGETYGVPVDSGDLVVEGRIGIGTTSPQRRLELTSHSRSAAQLVLTDPDAHVNQRRWFLQSRLGQFRLGAFDDLCTSNSGLLAINQNGNFGIGTVNPQAALEVNSTTSGLLPPRMTTHQRDNIDPTIEGMVIYNTSINNLQHYNGTSWVSLGGSRSRAGSTTITISGGGHPTTATATISTGLSGITSAIVWGWEISPVTGQPVLPLGIVNLDYNNASGDIQATIVRHSIATDKTYQIFWQAIE